jgi:hypothetical protein
MSTINRCAALCALVLGIAAGCSGDDDDTVGSKPPVTGAAGEGGADAAPDQAPEAGAGGVIAAPETGGAGTAGETGGAPTTVEVGGAGGAASTNLVEGGAGGAAGDGGGDTTDPLATSIVLDVNDVAANPAPYAWFDFRPNVQKLILAGAPETQHIAILWYTVVDGAVGLHYHAKTESVYVIDGTQTDAKGTYTDGTVYFNPPTSGHAISASSGFFLLASAATSKASLLAQAS